MHATESSSDQKSPDQSKLTQIITDLRSLARDTWITSLIISFAAVYVHDLVSINSIILITSIAIGYAIAYAFNDFKDVNFDKYDEKKSQRNYFVRSDANYVRLVMVLVILLAILTIVAIQFQIRGIIILLVSLFVMWAYSSKPLRFKSRPGLDLISHSLFVSTYPYYIVLFLYKINLIDVDYLALTILVLFSFGEQLENQIRDFEVDLMTDTNFTTRFGRSISLKLMKISTFIAIVVIYYFVFFGNLPIFLIPYAFLNLPYFISRLLRSEDLKRSDFLINSSKLLNALYSLGVLFYLIFYN